ncbi:efflux RND transporter permease subunit [Thalassotalea fusca]
MSHSNRKITDIFVNRPILALVISLIISIAGLWAVKQITVLQFPKIESASLTIETTYIGAQPSIVKGFVTDPIERIAATVPGVEYVDSETKAGYSKVTAWLALNENSTMALAELNTRLSQIGFELPSGAEDPVVSVTRADRPYAVFYLNVSSEHMNLSELSDYLTRQINPSINNIAGVQRVGIEGARTPAMRIWLQPTLLESLNVSAAEVYQALSVNNQISTLGYLDNQSNRLDVVANTQLSSVEDFEQIIIKESHQGTIFLADVAKVEIDAETPQNTARFDTENTVYISVWPLPGANELEIGNALYQVVETLNQKDTQGIHINLAYDGTLYMRDAINEIVITLFETVLLVGIVVLLLMGSWRTALVPLITIPISLLGAIAAIWLMGFSLNLLTVLAIVLSVGLVVDDAIVVVENVARHMRSGMSKIEAALLSSRQLLVPIISMTLTLALVYAPIGFLSGLTGALFKEFAFTLAVAVMVSGIVAITLSPIMSAHVNPEGGQEGRLTKRVNRIFESVQTRYSKWLTQLLSRQGQVSFVAIVLMLLIVPFYLFSAKELAPMEDQSSVTLVMQSPPDGSLNYTEQHITPVVEDLLTIKGTEQVWQILMPSGGFGGLEFAHAKERDYTTAEKLPEIYGRLSQSTGLNIFPVLPSPLPTAGQFDVEMVIKSSDNHYDMNQYAQQLVQSAYQSGLFMYADTDLKVDLPQLELVLDKQKIADLGLTVAQVSSELSTYLSTNFVNRFEHFGKAYRVIPQVGDNANVDPDQILSLTIRAANGELIPFADFVELKWLTVPRALGSFAQQNSFKLYGGVLPGVTKGQALQAMEDIAREVLPTHYSIDYAGESRQTKKEGNSLLTVMAVSLLVIFLLLAVQFNSFRDPLVVLLGSVPLALSGALVWSYLSFTTLNIYSQIGLVTLVGLVVKNGILIVEFANHLQTIGKDKMTAIVEAAKTRLRPILMTSAATILGHFPLILVTGAGAESRNSIGIILVAGMFIGTIFTLFILPTIYLLIAETRSVEISKGKVTRINQEEQSAAADAAMAKLA